MSSIVRHDTDERDALEREVARTLARIDGRAWGIAVGATLGLALLIATWVLVLRGGPVVGPHLALLGIFLPGYRVTMVGGVVGFVYAFVLGYALGRIVGILYNRIAGAAI